MKFSRPFAVDVLKNGAANRFIEANGAERAALAARLGLPGIHFLSADLAVTPCGGASGDGIDRLTVSGRLRADVRQICVVGLEAFDAHIDDGFAVAFAREETAGQIAPKDPGGDLVSGDLVRKDPPEPFDGAGIDLGELVAQQLALALDPHPRRPGLASVNIEFADKRENEGATGQSNPFAILRRLKLDNP